MAERVEGARRLQNGERVRVQLERRRVAVDELLERVRDGSGAAHRAASDDDGQRWVSIVGGDLVTTGIAELAGIETLLERVEGHSDDFLGCRATVLVGERPRVVREGYRLFGHGFLLSVGDSMRAKPRLSA